LTSKIMTTADPVSGETFTTEKMVDQVAISFWRGMKPALPLWRGRYI